MQRTTPLPQKLGELVSENAWVIRAGKEKVTMSKIREMAANGDEAAKAELEFRLNRVSEIVFEEPKIDGYDSMFGFERDDYKAAIRNGQQPCSK